MKPIVMTSELGYSQNGPREGLDPEILIKRYEAEPNTATCTQKELPRRPPKENKRSDLPAVLCACVLLVIVLVTCTLKHRRGVRG